MKRLKGLVLGIILCIGVKLEVRLWSRASGDTDAVVVETVVNRKEDDEEKRLFLFENSISADIFYVFLDYRPLGGNYDIVEECITQPSRVDACVVTVLTSSKQ